MNLVLTLLLRFWKPLAGLLAVVSLVLYLMHLGATHEATKRDLAKAKEDKAQAISLAEQALHEYERYAKAVEASEAIAAKAAASSASTQATTKELHHEVKKRIPAGTPAIHGGYRVLTDAAATGRVPATADASSAPSGADAAPVATQDAAETVIENYGRYHEIANRLLLLQQWVKEQCK